jgi:hypothetical protein
MSGDPPRTRPSSKPAASGIKVRIEGYRARANECELAAESAKDARTRQRFLELAKQWRDLISREEA